MTALPDVFLVYGEKGQSVEEHMGAIDAQPAEYERRVVAFFDRALLDEQPER